MGREGPMEGFPRTYSSFKAASSRWNAEESNPANIKSLEFTTSITKRQIDWHLEIQLPELRPSFPCKDAFTSNVPGICWNTLENRIQMQYIPMNNINLWKNRKRCIYIYTEIRNDIPVEQHASSRRFLQSLSMRTALSWSMEAVTCKKQDYVTII